MLTDTEKRGCRQILEKMSDQELRSLKDTITRRQILAENRNEAVKAILEYSQSAVELLRRKKLRRDLIFQYLVDCSVIVPVNSEKHELIYKTLQHWGSTQPQEDDLLEIEFEAGPAQSTAASQTDAGHRTTTGVGPAASGVAPASSGVAPAASGVALLAPAAGDGALSAGAAVVVQNAAPDLQVQTHRHQTLGETFVRWFYDLLNSQNPTHSIHPGDFGPHHFWENCTLKLVSRTPEVSEETFQGSVLVAHRFLALAQEELLVFNPNVTAEGVQVRSDPHGLLIVMACGTIHQHDNCLGVFQQMFGLVRSTLNENTWKIKTSQLQLCSSQVTAIPKLTDSSTNQLLSDSAALAIMPQE